MKFYGSYAIRCDDKARMWSRQDSKWNKRVRKRSNERALTNKSFAMMATTIINHKKKETIDGDVLLTGQFCQIDLVDVDGGTCLMQGLQWQARSD